MAIRAGLVLILAAGLCGWAWAEEAALRVPPVFGDHMVLQQGQPIPVWGWATPGANVTVTFTPSASNTCASSAAANVCAASAAVPAAPAPVSASAKAGEDGRWEVRLPAQTVSKEPCQFTVAAGEETLRFSDVLVGEVWLASGQSNMAWNLEPKIKDGEAEMAAADFPLIRQFTVQPAAVIFPPPETGTRWVVCQPATAGYFSAVGYFFARDLYRKLDIPIGILSCAWGGMPAQTFVSGEKLAAVPELEHYARQLAERKELLSAEALSPEAWREAKQTAIAQNAWISTAIAKLADNELPFARPDFDDSAWPEATLPAYWETIPGFETYDGIGWFRKAVAIPADWVGRELELYLGKIDDRDITFVNGVEVGRGNRHTEERRYRIPPEATQGGRLVVAVRCFDTGGNGGLYGGDRFAVLPVGQEEGEISLAGAWKYRLGGEESHPIVPLPPLPGTVEPSFPSALFTGMVQTIIPYAIRGTIWYQGESNASAWREYRILFPALIMDWRERWGYPFPFLWCQLANYLDRHNEPVESDWAGLREAQSMTLSLPATGQAVLIDNANPDNPHDIHPRDKQTVGHRLALLARKICYGEPNLVASGPAFAGFSVAGERMTLVFDQPLVTKDGGPPTGFALAGEDGVYHWAEGEIDGNRVVLTAKEVQDPQSVRYGWDDNPACNLYNAEGLPASPFRAGEEK